MSHEERPVGGKTKPRAWLCSGFVQPATSHAGVNDEGLSFVFPASPFFVSLAPSQRQAPVSRLRERGAPSGVLDGVRVPPSRDPHLRGHAAGGKERSVDTEKISGMKQTWTCGGGRRIHRAFFSERGVPFGPHFLRK